MEILKAIKIKNGNAMIGLLNNGTVISVTVYDRKSSIDASRYPFANFKLQEEDKESYEPVSIYSFNRMLRLAQYRINNSINQ